MPLSGTIESFNEELEAAPEIVNDDPYGKGWMIKIKLTNKEEVKSLLDDKGYENLLNGD